MTRGKGRNVALVGSVSAPNPNHFISNSFYKLSRHSVCMPEVEDLIANPEIRESLERITKHEDELEKKYKSDPIFKGMDSKPYWEMYDVPVEWKVVRPLLLAGVVKKFGKKYYTLKDRQAIRTALQEYGEYRKLREADVAQIVEQGIPNDMFDVIEGFEDLKEFFFLALAAEDPVNCFMVGGPGTAKTLFLMELERLGGRFITAGTATKVGIRDIIYDELPRILIIDELDKISDSKDLSALLTWMESGRIIITKHELRDEKKGKGWVFAAANTVRNLPPELLDRFQVFHIKPYTREQFISTVKGYLTKRMSIDQSLAEYIAQQVQRYSVSVREAIRIARLAKTPLEVDRVIRIVTRYMST